MDEKKPGSPSLWIQLRREMSKPANVGLCQAATKTGLIEKLRAERMNSPLDRDILVSSRDTAERYTAVVWKSVH